MTYLAFQLTIQFLSGGDARYQIGLWSEYLTYSSIYIGHFYWDTLYMRFRFWAISTCKSNEEFAGNCIYMGPDGKSQKDLPKRKAFSRFPLAD